MPRASAHTNAVAGASFPGGRLALGAVALVSALALGACRENDEQTVRADLAPWLSLGAMQSFTATEDCTAARFVAASDEVKSTLTLEDTPQSALRVLRKEGAVAVRVPGLTPTQVSEWIATQDFPIAVSVVAVGRAARSCMDAGYEKAFLAALEDPMTILVLDKAGLSLSVLDRRNKVIFYAKGSQV